MTGNKSTKSKFEQTALVPTTTAHQQRLQLFQATRRPKLLNQTAITPYGKIRLKAKLGQGHADVLEAIITTVR